MKARRAWNWGRVRGPERGGEAWYLSAVWGLAQQPQLTAHSLELLTSHSILPATTTQTSAKAQTCMRTHSNMHGNTGNLLLFLSAQCSGCSYLIKLAASCAANKQHELQICFSIYEHNSWTCCVLLNTEGIQGVWGYERDCVSERIRCWKGEVTCSHKDGTQQHEHRTAAKNKHRLKARVRQKEQETLLSPHSGYTDACTTPPLYTTTSVNLS